jgi:CO/xanthine dehydrogenase FAD-binding subunit
VAPIPWLENEVSAQLAGLNASEESIAQISKQALSKAEPLAQNMIKKLLLKLTV